MRNPVGSRGGFVTVFILIIIGVVVTLLSPSERMLGDTAKLVYLHGALVWVSLTLFTVTGVIGVTQLVFNNRKAGLYLLVFEETATVFWLASTVLGFVVAYLAWGGMVWIEPRVTISIIILMLALTIYFISTEYSNLARNGILAVILALTIGGLIMGDGRVFHPENSVAQSETSIQLAFVMLVTVFLLAALQTVRIRLPSGISDQRFRRS